MKEYFTLDESLAFLNKDLDTEERINLRDLLSFAAQRKIKPCFYYSGDLLWREERKQYNYMKGYLEKNFQGYLSHPSLGQCLYENYLNHDTKSFSIKFVQIFEVIGANIIPNDETMMVLYDAALHSAGCEEKYNQLSEENKRAENIWAFSFLDVGYTQIPLAKVYFHKKELLKLKNLSHSEDSEVTILKNEQDTEAPNPIKQQFQDYINSANLINYVSQTQGKDFTEIVKLFSFYDVAEIPIYKKRDDWKIIKVDEKNNPLFQMLNNLIQIDYENLNQCPITFEQYHNNNLNILQEAGKFYWKIEDILNLDFIQHFRVKKHIEWEVFHASGVWISLRTPEEIEQDNKAESLYEESSIEINAELENTTASLELDVAIEKDKVKKITEENEKLNDELKELKQQIEHLKEQQESGTFEANPLTGLAKLNQSAQDRQGMARIIAASLWANEANILIGDMANKVYAIMVDYCKDDLPQQTETVKNWIRPVATQEAQRRGRQSIKSKT